MNIAIIASGSRGDVQPYLALGVGLNEAGHHVRFVTNSNYADLVRNYEVDPWLVAGDVQAVAKSASMQDQIEGGNFIRLMAEMSKAAKGHALHLGKISLAACQDMDVILGGLGGVFVASALGEKLNIPVIQAYLVPFSRTRAFASPLTPNLPIFKSASYFITRQMIWQGFRSAENALRREVLDLPNAPFFGPYRSEAFHGMPVLYGFSPAVIRKPEDWGEQIHLTGYWTLPEKDDWQPDPALSAFLKQDPQPIYIGFGSMPSRNPAETARMFLDALQAVGQRAVICSGWAGFEKLETSDFVFVTSSVPHTWLFPRVAAVIHHGGAGTTAAGLRAGVPTW